MSDVTAKNAPPAENGAIEFTVTTSIDERAIKSLLSAAFEGGSNYWYEIVDHEFPDGITYDDFREGGRFTDPDDYWHPCQIIPLKEGCTVFISDGEDDTFKLNRETIARGLKVMHEKYPRHWKDVGTIREDAVTGDVFLQCCLFGCIVFG